MLESSVGCRYQKLGYESCTKPEPCHYSSRKSTPDPQLVQDPVDDYIPVSGIGPTDAMYVFLMNFFLQHSQGLLL